MHRLIKEEAVTISNRDNVVSITCDDSGDAEEIFEWLLMREEKGMNKNGVPVKWDIYKPTGKWGYGGVIYVPADLPPWELTTEMVRDLQDQVVTGTFSGNWVLVLSNDDSFDYCGCKYQFWHGMKLLGDLEFSDDLPDISEQIRRVTEIVNSWPKWKQDIMKNALSPTRKG